MQEKIKVSAIAENIFDISYLISAISMGVYLLTASPEKGSIAYMFGVLAVTLAAGDSFHLVPRIVVNFKGNKERLIPYLGFGKLITSITMTIVYLMLFQIWQMLYPQNFTPKYLKILMLALVIIRIILCLMPQNKWLKQDALAAWGVIRNIPFVAIGLIVGTLFFYSSCYAHDGFSYMWLAILLSFLFYIPVVLWSDKYPKLGMLMLPKTMSYIFIISMGFSVI